VNEVRSFSSRVYNLVFINLLSLSLWTASSLAAHPIGELSRARTRTRTSPASIAPVRELINHHSPRQQQISLFPARETGCPRPARRYQLSLSTPTTPPLSSIAVRVPFAVVNVKGKWHVRRRITPSVICGRDNAAGRATAIFGNRMKTGN